jgi:hypothetical protein
MADASLRAWTRVCLTPGKGVLGRHLAESGEVLTWLADGHGAEIRLVASSWVLLVNAS